MTRRGTVLAAVATRALAAVAGFLRASTAAKAKRPQFQRCASKGRASAADSNAASRPGQSGRRVTTPAG